MWIVWHRHLLHHCKLSNFLQLMVLHGNPPIDSRYVKIDAPLLSWAYIAADETLQLRFALTDHQHKEGPDEKTEMLAIPCPQNVWIFRYGSIQVIKHWIQARIFRKLERAWSSREWEGISKLFTIIPRTIILQEEIDEEYQNHVN